MKLSKSVIDLVNYLGHNSIYDTTFVHLLYCKLFDTVPKYSILYSNYIKDNNLIESEDLLDLNEVFENIKSIFKNAELIQYRRHTVLFDKDVIIVCNRERFYDNTKNDYCERCYDIIVCCNDESTLDKISNPSNFVFKEKSDVKSMSYVVKTSMGFNTKFLNIKNVDCDISFNYNDDFPHDKIKNIIESDESGIIILNGLPGTGKTSYIRHLIYNSDKNFVFLDSSCFNYIDDCTFIDLLLDNKNNIFVLEDCETLLQDRAVGNHQLSSLLNLSDGILGDSLKLKFICTFNSDLTKIDKAILRKGRLKLKYEFNKLSSDKVVKLAKKLNKNISDPIDMALCEIYNYGEENNKSKTTKIGFV